MDEGPRTSRGVRVAKIFGCVALFLYGLSHLTDHRVSPDDLMFMVPLMMISAAGACGAARDEMLRWLKFGALASTAWFVSVVLFIIYVFATGKPIQN